MATAGTAYLQRIIRTSAGRLLSSGDGAKLVASMAH
jgi:hypothetical protein